MKHQELLIQRLQASLNPGESLAQVLADLLNISLDSAYRRINSKTSFSIDEAIWVANEFDLSLDSLLDPNQEKASVIFQDLEPSYDGFGQYLDLLYQNLKQIKRNPDSLLYYSCLDIPIFLNLSSPLTAAFKIFYWMHSIMEVPDLQEKIFEPEVIPQEFVDKGLQIWETYSEIKSVEMWTTDTLNSTLRQIQYYHQAGYIIDAKVSSALYDELDHLVDRVNTMAERGTKIINRIPEEHEKDNYALYESDIELTGNGAIAVNGEHKRSFIGHLTFHTLVSDNQALNDKTLSWYLGLMRKASLISSVSAKLRYQFISHLKSEVRTHRERNSIG